MTAKVAVRSLADQLQQVDQLHHLLELPPEPVTPLTDGSPVQLAEVPLHSLTHMGRQLTSLSMPSGLLIH